MSFRFSPKLVCFVACCFANSVAFGLNSKIEDDASACAKIPSAMARLGCFDDLVDKYNLNGPEPTLFAEAGEWVISESLNPLDDTSTVTAMLASENASNYLGKKVTLILRCKSGRAEAYINWDNYLGSTAVVTDRIDKAQAERLGWTLSTDAQASFRPRPQGFMDALSKATTYIAQVTPYNESPVTASFSVVGARQVVDRIKVSCGW